MKMFVVFQPELLFHRAKKGNIAAAKEKLKLNQNKHLHMLRHFDQV